MERLRMCIACREMQDKKDLLRVVKDKENHISIDLTGKKNGRGAYICKSTQCLQKAQKTSALSRAFETNIDNEVYEALREALKQLEK